LGGRLLISIVLLAGWVCSLRRVGGCPVALSETTFYPQGKRLSLCHVLFAPGAAVDPSQSNPIYKDRSAIKG
jgi:hypothetical protein